MVSYLVQGKAVGLDPLEGRLDTGCFLSGTNTQSGAVDGCLVGDADGVRVAHDDAAAHDDVASAYDDADAVANDVIALHATNDVADDGYAAARHDGATDHGNAHANAVAAIVAAKASPALILSLTTQ